MEKYKKILIIRTDRLGDVVLSTPVIKSLREVCPGSHIAMMVRPYTCDVIKENPYLDEIIIYDKKGRHKGWLASLNFARTLKKRKFDIAIVLHATNRVNIMTWLARIPKRTGWNRKLGFLLTDPVPYTKGEGLKHETEYNYELLKSLGINLEPGLPYIKVSSAARIKVEELLAENGIEEKDRFVVVHPGASCRSKLWPSERYGEIIKKLNREYRIRSVLVGGKETVELSKQAEEKNSCTVNLTG